jgi:hypothetical protein
MLSFFKKHTNYFTILLFTVLFLSGSLHLPLYPENFDTKSEQAILFMNYLEYREILNPGSLSSDDHIFQGNFFTSIHLSPDRDHGVSVMYPFLPVLINENNISPYAYGLIWHGYIYFLFFIGTVFIYLLLRKLTDSNLISIIGVTLYFLSPRFFADGLHNSKDIVFLTILAALMYFGLRMNEDEDFISVILFAVSGGFLCNTRSIGFLFLALFGAFYIYRKAVLKRLNLINFLRGLTAALGTLFIYVLITPACFYDRKLHLVDQISYSLLRSAHFDGWWAPQLFSGHIYDWKIESLPWYYLPKYILITTPPVTIFLFLSGMVSLALMLFKIKRNSLKLNYGIFYLICVLIPMLSVMLGHSVLYNGWRHFYFIHGFLITVCIIGLDYFYPYIKEHSILNKTCLSILFLCTLFYYIGNLTFGVGGSMYFNLFAGRSVPTRYEMDYYGVTGKEILTRLDKTCKDTGDIYIYAPKYHISVLENALWTLSLKDNRNIKLISSRDEAFSKMNDDETVYCYFSPVYANWFDHNEWIIFKDVAPVVSYRPWGRNAGLLYDYYYVEGY